MNVFTVDVEEWFHVCGVPALDRAHWDELTSRVVPTTRRLLDMLDAAQVRATFFTLGWVAERHPTLVAEIVAAGHEVGSHSHWHRRVYELTPEAFTEDLRSAGAALTAAGAPSPCAYRAPEWSINNRSLWALPLLAREGYHVDASMAPVKLVGDSEFPHGPHVRVTGPQPLVELPPLVTRRFGQTMPIGWGWALRMSAPRHLLSAIARVNARGWPAVLTVHPWELDPDPPRVALPARLRFAHYFRLAGFEQRLTTILRATTFSTLQAAAAAVSRT